MTPVRELQQQCRLFHADMEQRKAEVCRERRTMTVGVFIITALLLGAFGAKLLTGLF